MHSCLRPGPHKLQVQLALKVAEGYRSVTSAALLRPPSTTEDMMDCHPGPFHQELRQEHQQAWSPIGNLGWPLFRLPWARLQLQQTSSFNSGACPHWLLTQPRPILNKN